MDFYAKDWLINTDDQKVLNTPFWRSHADRLTTVALMTVDSGRNYAKAAHARLLCHVTRIPDVAALVAYRRAIRLMDAFVALTPADRDALDGKTNPIETAFMSGDQAHAHMVERRRQVQNSHPAIAEFFAELRAEAEAIAEAQRKQIAAHQAGVAETERGWAEAPGRVIAWHKQGIRLDIRGGRAVAFPASRMKQEDREFLTAHNVAIAAAVQAEWTV